MASERVTISLPAEVRRAAQEVAEAEGKSFSAVVNEAIAVWMRMRLMDLWSADYQAENGPFDEDQLRAVAEKVGIPYTPPNAGASAA